jgi:hypothetical protein
MPMPEGPDLPLDDRTAVPVDTPKPRAVLDDRALEVLAAAGVGGAMVACGAALAAGLPDAALLLGSVAVSMAAFAAVAPMLAAAVQRMVEEHASPDWCRVWWVFGLGAVYACLQAAGLGLSAVLLLPLAWNLVTCIRRMPGLVKGFASGGVASASLWVTAGLATLTAVAAIVSAAGSPRLGDPAAQGAMDGAALALAFFALLMALAPDPQEEDDLLLPPRWGALYLLHNCGVAGVALVQAWVWRFQGASATGLMVFACAAAIASTSILWASLLQRRGRGKPHPLAWPLALTGLVLVGELQFVIAAATDSVQAAGRALTSVEVPVWPWGWRLPLLLVAMVALQAAGRRPGRSALAVWAQGVAIALLLIGEYFWVQQSGLAGPMLSLAGVIVVAGPWLRRSTR